MADTGDHACGPNCVDCATANGGAQPKCQTGKDPPMCGCSSESDCPYGEACVGSQCTMSCDAQHNCKTNGNGSNSYCCTRMTGGTCTSTDDCENGDGCGSNGVCSM